MIRALLCLILFCGVAQAQAPQPQSPELRALNMRLGAEINGSLQCSAAVITLQDKLTASEAEVKKLTDKYEPKKEELK